MCLGTGAELKVDAVVGLCKIYMVLARFTSTQRRLSFTVGVSVPAFWVKLGANELC